MHWAVGFFDFYFRTKLLRQKIPLLASFKLTYRCNLACRACPFHQRATRPDAHMTWATAVNALQELKKQGCRIVIFEGGEPFLWTDAEYCLRDLIVLAKKLFVRVGVTTNGTFPLDVPADVIWVSIDGMKKTHDLLRESSFDRAWKNLKQSTHQKVLVHVTLNRLNRQELGGLLEKLRSAPAVRGVTVQLFYPYGQGEDDLGLSRPERKEVMEQAIMLKKKGCPVLNSDWSLKAMIDNSWNCHEDILINVDPDGTISRGCYAKNRGEVKCAECGFTPVAEASGALNLRPGSLRAGWRIFIAR